MKKVTMVAFAAGCIALLAVPAMAAQSASCGWEDASATILGSFGNLGSAVNVTDPVHSGGRSLEVSESPLGGTPQAYLIYIEGLIDGDVIDACFWGYDTTPDASPSLRIWGHYALSGDVLSFEGSAGGNETYTDGLGWSQLCHSWVFDSALGTRDALVVEARLYSDADGQTQWIDDASVIISSDTATITTPCTGAVSVEPSTWGQVKADYR